MNHPLSFYAKISAVCFAVSGLARRLFGVVAAAAALALFAAVAPAHAASCKEQASEKKLAGAAQKSFMQKCEREAKASCDMSAGEKKLAGAAKTSFTKKCVTDAIGH